MLGLLRLSFHLSFLLSLSMRHMYPGGRLSQDPEMYYLALCHRDFFFSWAHGHAFKKTKEETSVI